MSLTLRQSSLTGAVTVDRLITYAEMDANLSGLADGSNWASSVVASSSVAITGAFKTSISTDTAQGYFYRADATFNGTVDHGTFFGYNLDSFGQIKDSAKPALMIGMESDYNDGTTRHIELHLDIAQASGSFKRAFAADLQT